MLCSLLYWGIFTQKQQQNETIEKRRKSRVKNENSSAQFDSFAVNGQSVSLWCRNRTWRNENPEEEEVNAETWRKRRRKKNCWKVKKRKDDNGSLADLCNFTIILSRNVF